MSYFTKLPPITKSISLITSLHCRSFHSTQLQHSKLTESEVRKYSDILEIPYNASDSRLKKAFYKKSKETHPDLNKSENASQQFEKVSEAYEKLLAHRKVILGQSATPYISNRSIKDIRTSWRPREKRKPYEKNNYSQTFASADPDYNESKSSSFKRTTAFDYLDNTYKTMLKRDSLRHAKNKATKKNASKDSKNDCVIQ